MKRIAIIKKEKEGYWVEVWNEYGQSVSGALVDRSQDVDAFVETMRARIVSDCREVQGD